MEESKVEPQQTIYEFSSAVSHILEIFDFPTTVTSDADAIFDEIKSCGARILKINSSSSSQSLNNSHGNNANQKPTILAIFKSAGEAQRALETVTSPYYKLRVSQKSPTHFAGGDCGPPQQAQQPSSHTLAAAQQQK